MKNPLPELRGCIKPLCPLILKFMRLTTLLFLTGFVHVSAITLSQNNEVSLSLNDVRLTEVFDVLSNNTETKFLYRDETIPENLVSIHTENKPVSEILDEVLEGTDISYKFLSKDLVVIALKDFLKKQENTITGKVVDTEGEPLAGVNIIFEGTTIGTITDIEGYYSIDYTDANATIVFSYIGYITQKVPIGGQKIIDVTMKPDVESMEEVVVVGYGVQKKVTLTGSVSSIDGDVLKQSPTANFTNTLSGRIPGLVTYTRDGEPGYDNATIRIRGLNTLDRDADDNIDANGALIVVDGIANRSMERLDPANIESISVLKDASAAIYGAQAANGVILITTKRGKTGKPKVTLNYNQGYGQPTVIPDMTDAATYATMLNELDLYRGRDLRFSEEDIELYANGSDPWGYPNTDWFGETFKTWTPQNAYSTQVEGGSEYLKYFVSLGGKYQDGIYKNGATYYKQYNFRSNLDGKITDNINIGFDISGRQEDRNFPTQKKDDIFRMLQRGKPNLPAYWPDGTPGPDIEYGFNPVVISTDATGYDTDKRYILETNLRLNIDIPWVEGLSFSSNMAFDKFIKNRKRFEKPWYLYTWDGSYDTNGNPVLNKGARGPSEPNLTVEMQDEKRITANALVNYTKSFGNHNLNLLVGTERYEREVSYLDAYRRYFVSDKVDQMFAGGRDEMDNGGRAEQTSRLNYFGRINYNYNEKYLLEFVWRYDGSYNFPKSYRWGFFPGISTGWRISEEDFWKNNISLINQLKIRGSWGQTGNDRIKDYQYLASYSYDPNHYYVFGIDKENLLLNEQTIPNPYVTWEVANQFDIGFDLQMFEGKITLEADYFHNNRSNILIPREASVPATSGISASLPDENIGEVVNQGFDYSLGYRNVTGNLRYSININGGYQRNEIKFWDETPGIPDYQKSTGSPIPNDPANPDNDLYYNAIGVFSDEAAVEAYPHWANARPGDLIFEDVNGDTVIDGLDRVRIDKREFPKYSGGISINLGYKQFDLSILFQGTAGAARYIKTESGEMGNYLQEFAEARWTPTNTNASGPRAFNRDEEYWMSQRNTYFLRDANYIRLKNLELGYNTHSNFNDRLHIAGLRIYVNAMNLLTFDSLKVFDPETTNTAGTYYPLSRIINVGSTLTF